MMSWAKTEREGCTDLGNSTLPAVTYKPRLRVAEFFAGVGLVRKALEASGFEVVFANDISRDKYNIYSLNFDSSCFLLGDIAEIRGAKIPDIDLATAGFPCTDLSLAGLRQGLNGKQSGTVTEFIRILDEMDARRPPAVMIENVPGFATSRRGDDLNSIVGSLNGLGYLCDILEIDARRFVPQSRSRLFILGSRNPQYGIPGWVRSKLRPPWIRDFVLRYPELAFASLRFPDAPDKDAGGTLDSVVERLDVSHSLWWNEPRKSQFIASLSSLNSGRLSEMCDSANLTWATAYRRTRRSGTMWEIRGDQISGCLRTGSGGSSRQAVVEAGTGQFRVRWMTGREYARLQGAEDLNLTGVTESKAKFALGDAVCVPVVRWLAENCLPQLVRESGVPVNA